MKKEIVDVFLVKYLVSKGLNVSIFEICTDSEQDTPAVVTISFFSNNARVSRVRYAKRQYSYELTYSKPGLSQGLQIPVQPPVQIVHKI